MATTAPKASDPKTNFGKLIKKLSAKPEAQRTDIEKTILRAADLERQRANLLKQVDDNRKFLRLADSNNLLTDEEGAAVDEFYPEKERGSLRSKEDVEATRNAKNEARQS